LAEDMRSTPRSNPGSHRPFQHTTPEIIPPAISHASFCLDALYYQWYFLTPYQKPEPGA
jgi:hypothetical protein